ncbi:MAG: tetratricopeptide repeat protein [Phycisphaerae bacterium]
MADSHDPRSPCPPDDRLHAFADLGPEAYRDDDAELARHLETCEPCRARLEAIRKDNALMAALAATPRRNTQTLDETGPPSPAPMGPASIPGYDIVSEIQRGAQGVVYRAIQQATKRTVALKVMLSGAFASVRQRQRFEREIDLAAALQHPAIATVFDSGVAPDGSCYFAMEYIDGQPLDAYMRSVRDAGPTDDPKSVNTALKLFAKICEAVHHAHQHGVIHRDLKPANIRVDPDGRPHVLDFGLAKLTGVEAPRDGSLRTLTGEFVGTLAYASPEQTKGDPRGVDTLTDVYSLGVILYEMLTGHLPYSVTGPIVEVLRSIAEADPEPPSSWYRRSMQVSIKGDEAPYRVNYEIDTIILKALAKEKPRRYASVEAFRRDIEHYLAGEPIDAKRDSTWYVFQKTVRRKKGPFSAAAAMILVVSGFLIYRTSAIADMLDAERTFSHQLSSMILRVDPYKTAGAHATVETMLDQECADLDASPPRAREQEARLRHLIGKAYKEHGYYDKALRELTAAVDIRRNLTKKPDETLAQTLNDLASVYYKQGAYAKAEPVYEEALAARRALGVPADIAETLTHLATVRQRQGRFPEALAMFRQAVDQQDRGRRPGTPVRFAGRMNLATCLTEMGRYTEAESLYRQSLAAHIERVGEDHVFTAMVKTALARCLIRLGQYAEAQSLLDEALAVKKRQPNPRHPTVAITLQYRAELNRALGDLEAAERDCRAALNIERGGLPPGHRRIAESLTLLGTILVERGEAAAAEPVLREARETAAVTLVPDHYRICDAERALGDCLTALGRYDEAEPLLLKSYARIKAVLGTEHDLTRAALSGVIALYEARGMPEETERYRALLLARSGEDAPMESP